MQMLRCVCATPPQLCNGMSIVVVPWHIALIWFQSDVTKLVVFRCLCLVDLFELLHGEVLCQLDVVACSLVDSCWFLLQNSAFFTKELSNLIAPHLCMVVLQNAEETVRAMSGVVGPASYPQNKWSHAQQRAAEEETLDFLPCSSSCAGSEKSCFAPRGAHCSCWVR